MSPVLSDDRLIEIASRLSRVPGVIGVVLGGSRAGGTASAQSDVDLGLYYRPPVHVDALAALARAVAGPAASVTRPGEWGPWVDGGAWLDIGGTAVDWIYRDLDRVRTCWQDAQLGRYAFHFQVGHPLGVPDFAYVGELALARVLADPTGEIAAAQSEMSRYPARLGTALVTASLEEASFCVAIAGKAVGRADAAYVAGCLFRAVLLCAHALHGHAERWLINEKGAVAAAGRLADAPPDFSARAHGILADIGTEPGQLKAALRAAADLIDDVGVACGVS
jgi:hypothetical protein